MTIATSRRRLIAVSAAFAASGCDISPRASQNSFAIWGPPAGPSIVLAYAEHLGLLRPVAPDIVVSAWRSPDELRAGLTSETIQLSIMPLNTAANFYNRGQDVRLLNIMTRGLLYVISEDERLSSISALKGKRLAVPYRKDAPDIVLQRLLTHHGIADSDLSIRVTGSPIEATQLLLTGQVDAAFAPEPAISAAVAAGALIGKRIRRTIDVQRAWRTIAGPQASLPQAGLAVTGAFAQAQGQALERLRSALVEAARATIEHPSEAAGAAAATFGLPRSVLESSIAFSNLVAVPANEARLEVEQYFSAIHELDPDILAGRLPDADFYL